MKINLIASRGLWSAFKLLKEKFKFQKHKTAI